MKIKTLTLLAVAGVVPWGYGFQDQRTAQTSTGVEASAAANSKTQAKSDPASEASLGSGTQIDARMSSSLDVKKAKLGDPFQMKTNRPIKRDGKEVFGKGSIITGHVGQVSQSDGNTQIKLVFDQIEDRKSGTTASLQAMATAVSRTNASTASSDTTTMNMPRQTPPPNRSPGGGTQGGGLLGGTVGGVADNTLGGATGTLGTTVESAAGATLGADAAPSGIGTTPIRIVNEASAGLSSGSMLAVSGRNPKIEGGTEFLLKTTADSTVTRQAGK
jgi:hypothetical protein